MLLGLARVVVADRRADRNAIEHVAIGLEISEEPVVVLVAGVAGPQQKAARGVDVVAGREDQARVVLVEPLGAKDIVHLERDELALRAIGTPGRRPRVGESVGVVVDTARLRYFDDVTGLAV